MKKINLVLIMFILLSCTGKKVKTNIMGKQPDYLIEPEIHLSVPLDSFQLIRRYNDKGFFVKDTSKYSQYFLQKLYESKTAYDTAILIEDTLYLKYKINTSSTGNKVISVFRSCKLPNSLPINETIQYTAIRDDSIYNLYVERTNYTNLDYKFLINNHLIKSGISILNPLFYIGGEPRSESNDDRSLFFIDFYLDRVDCYVNIGIEINSGSRATFLIFPINDKQKSYDGLPIFKRK